MSDIYTITRNLSLQIDNDIEEFIVRSVQEYGMNESITVNAKKIYEALEKQVAKKPVDRFMFKECPTCGSVEIAGCGHCPECGQKLDRSDEE